MAAKIVLLDNTSDLSRMLLYKKATTPNAANIIFELMLEGMNVNETEKKYKLTTIARNVICSSRFIFYRYMIPYTNLCTQR